MEKEFLKYERSGAYHWRQLSGSLKRYNAGLAGRYTKALDLSVGINPATILDIGCGDGCLTMMFAKKYPDSRITGIDSSETAIKIALEKTRDCRNVNFVKSSCYDVGFKIKFDMIICADVIEHLSDYQGFILNCFNLLAHSGYLILTTPVRIQEFPQDQFHVREFFPTEIKEVITQTGFEIIKHHLSHPLSVRERYTRVLSPLGIGRIRLNKYIMNFRSLYLNKNPFIDFEPERYIVFEMQSILARKTSKP